jgi:hypothetical protein
MSAKRVILSAILVLGIFNTVMPSANGFLGIGDCKAVKSKISGFESKVIRDLNYIYGLAGVRPSVNSAQGVKVYEKHQSVVSSLKAIQKAGKSKPKCFNPKQTIALGNQMRWSINSYVQLNVLSEKYWISRTLEYQPLGTLK